MPTIIGCSALFTLVNYLLSPTVDITLLFVLDIAVWIGINMVLSRMIYKRTGVKF